MVLTRIAFREYAVRRRTKERTIMTATQSPVGQGAISTAQVSYALVDSTGTLQRSFPTSGVVAKAVVNTTTNQVQPGQYTVQFAGQKVTTSAYVASLSSGNISAQPSGGITLSVLPNTDDTLLIQTFDKLGTAANYSFTVVLLS
jgi:predicted extracellular nuclease